MELKKIQYFLTLCETLNFSTAARNLRITQPALSKSIKAFETQLGGALLRREGRLTHLTPLGEKMVPSLKAIEQSIRSAENVADAIIGKGSAVIRVATMCTISPNKFTGFLTGFQRRHPNIPLEFRNAAIEDIQKMLLEGDVDIALAASPVQALPRFKVLELYQERMVLAFGKTHRLNGTNDISLDSLDRHDYLDRTLCEFREAFLSETAIRKININVIISSDRDDWIISLLKKGLGVSIMSECAARTAGLEFAVVNDCELQRSIFLAVARGREDHKAILDFLAEIRTFEW